MDITLHGIQLTLLGGKAVYWPAQQMLLVADPHFGKEATFRSGGIPVPTGSTTGTLKAIEDMLTETAARRLVILGDMFHNRDSLSEDVKGSLANFFCNHDDVQFTLVLGNHDANLGALPPQWPLAVKESLIVDRVALTHDPATWPGDVDLVLCGHLHPAVRVQSLTDSAGKLPCYWASRQRLVLPAIGQFTGTHVIKPKHDDQVWLIAERQVIEHRHRATQEVR